jgi:hypothetical protein
VAEFIEPIVENVIAVLETRTPELLEGLDPFVQFGKQFTGVAVNFPAVWVMPVRTVLDPEQQHLRHQAHQLTVKFGVSASDPDQVTTLAMRYMELIDQALLASDGGSDWDGVLQAGSVLRVFVQGHDYGPLYERGGIMSRFPELDLVVETSE